MPGQGRQPAAGSRPARLGERSACESVDAFFDREVKPHVRDGWIDGDTSDEKDGEVGVVGYEFNFNRYFYRCKPLRPLEAIEAEIREVEKDIVRMLGEGTGGVARGEVA